MINKQIKNVILITIDCLRADYINSSDLVNYAPNINNLCKHSIVFKNTISNGPGTAPAFTSIFTSTYPLAYNTYSLLDEDKITFPELLDDEIKKGAVLSTVYLSRLFGYNRGFTEFKDFFETKIKDSLTQNQIKFKKLVKKLFNKLIQYGQIKKIYLYFYYMRMQATPDFIPAEIITKHGIDFLCRYIPDKKFLWLHYMDVHAPYIPNRYTLEFVKSKLTRHKIASLNLKISDLSSFLQINEDDLNILKGIYKSEIKYVDFYIGKLINELKLRNILDETMIIFTADHGEEFLEHGKLFHCETLYDELIHVPLIVYLPHLKKGVIYDKCVSHIDIAPTILETFGILPHKNFVGKSLFHRIKYNKSNCVISEFANAINEDVIRYDLRQICCRTEKWKLILKDQGGVRELYNLKDDPQEKYNVYQKEKDVAQELEKLIADHKRQSESFKIKRKIRKK